MNASTILLTPVVYADMHKDYKYKFYKYYNTHTHTQRLFGIQYISPSLSLP